MAHRPVSWWLWLATLGLLVAGRLGPVAGVWAAIGVHTLHTALFLLRERRVGALPVQVRLTYLGLLLIGLWEPASFIHWLQAIGTAALVFVGYCPLARTLALFPWNLRRPLTWAVIRRSFFSRPVEGSILDVLNAPEG